MSGCSWKRCDKTITYLEEVPQVHEVSGEHELLRLGDEAVGHEAEVLDQLGGAVHAGVHVQLGASQQPQQQVVDLVQHHGGVGRQRQLPRGQVEGACGAEHLAEGVAGDEGDQQVGRRWRGEEQRQVTSGPGTSNRDVVFHLELLRGPEDALISNQALNWFLCLSDNNRTFKTAPVYKHHNQTQTGRGSLSALSSPPSPPPPGRSSRYGSPAPQK